MFTTRLRKVGGSVMLSVPPALLEVLNLRVGASVGLAVESGRLVIEPTRPPRYTLAELLAASDFETPLPAEARDWVDAPAVGREEL